MESETFLIPKDFRSKLIIYFAEPCGVETEYENGRRICKIPDNSVFITKFEREFGIIDYEFYLVDNEGSRILLPILDRRDFNDSKTNEPPIDKLAAFSENFSGIEGKGRAYSVGTYQEITDNYSGGFYEEFQRTAEKSLKECRRNLQK